MKVVDISSIDDSVVLYFDTEKTRINAYTLASFLVSVADAAKAANAQINPGYEIEIIVEALGEGSFKAKISAVYNKTKNLFSSQMLAGIIIALLSNYIYERTLAVDDSVKVEIHTDEVIIEKEDERIIVPRNVYNATREVERNPKFVQSIDKAFQTIKADEEIKGFGFVESMDSVKPEIIVDRNRIVSAAGEVIEEHGVRYVPEIVELQIVKAVLERGNRKWEFMWRGVKISAPVTSDSFYDDFFNHNITIAPGDSLEVRLVIKQIQDEDTGIYVNKGYEVVEVYKHIPRLRQNSLDEDL